MRNWLRTLHVITGIRILCSRAFWKHFRFIVKHALLNFADETDKFNAERKGLCSQCRKDIATCERRSGLDWHTQCDDCAKWWSPDRLYPLGWRLRKDVNG